MIEDQGKTYILKIGSKGEIFPPKEVRESLGLEKGQKILLRVEGEQLLVRKVHSVEEILKGPVKVVISAHAMKDMRAFLSKELEER
ncbi:MAG: AbrB/MazE/SpoVT family DNA-binding domain-containing protein [Promethearchaeota archaeon]